MLPTHENFFSYIDIFKVYFIDRNFFRSTKSFMINSMKKINNYKIKFVEQMTLTG